MLGCKDRFKSFPAPQSVALPVNFREHASVGRDSVEPSLLTAIADVCGISGPGGKTQKSRRIRMEPCGLELIDYTDVSLPLAHARPRGYRQCRCNIHALSDRAGAGRSRFCLRR